MYIPYQDIPDSARIWIYQSNRPFTSEELGHINEKATAFIEQWTRHGQNLQGSYTVKYDQFFVLAVDEGFNAVSGCSIDASVRFVKELEAALNIDLMNKLQVSFKDGDAVNIVSLAEFQDYAKAQKITENTIVFNNMVQTKAELNNQWEVPASQSWHQRFLS